MVAEDENPFSEPRDSAKLLDQAGEKAVMLIGRLMIAQSRIEPAAPRVDVEAMEACRAAMARTLAALHRTVEALGVAAGKNIQ